MSQTDPNLPPIPQAGPTSDAASPPPPATTPPPITPPPNAAQAASGGYGPRGSADDAAASTGRRGPYGPQPAWKQRAHNAWQYTRAHGAAASMNLVKLHGPRAVIRDMRMVQPTDAERPALAQRGVKNLTVQQFLLWRRSWLYILMVPACINALIGLISLFDLETEMLTGFGVFLWVVTEIIPPLAIPAATVLGLLAWTDHRRSRWVLTIGALVAFALPILTALAPIGWMMQLPDDPNMDVQVRTMQQQGIRMVAGLMYLLMLLPVVLSMIPGVLRACARIKSLLPESIVPGWFLVLSAPLYALLLLLVFIAINQMAGNLLLIIGVVLLMGAPAVYIVKTPLFVRPIATAEERREIGMLQMIYAGVVALAVLLLFIYLFTAEFLGQPLVGPEGTGMMTAGRLVWESFKFILNYLSRSMFITAVAIDLFMLVNLSVWRNTKKFQQTPEAAAYDELMEQFGQAADREEAGHGFEVVTPAARR